MEMGLNAKSVKVSNRQIFINKFIEKFPKAKLHTITDLNKYYNNIIQADINLVHIIDSDENSNDKFDNIILEYFSKHI